VYGIPNLTNVPLTNPIDQADIVLVKGDNLPPKAVGPLSSYDVQKIMAQIVNQVEQEPEQITVDKGIGKYGFNAYQLEQAGYVKPGTYATYIANNPTNFVDVMSSPSVWTGKDNIVSVDQLLANETKQTAIQNEIMTSSYQQLTQTGIITDPAAQAAQPVQGSVYTNSGVLAVSALALIGGNLGSLTQLAKNVTSGDLGQYVSESLASVKSLANGALAGGESVINYIKGLGSGLSNLDFSSLANNVEKTITGEIGALVANASKFGAPVASLWASATNLPGISLSSIGGLFGGTGTSPGSLNNILTGGGFNPTAIGTSLTGFDLTNNMNLLGKASQFSIDFSNPAASLNNFGNLGNLGNLGKLANLGDLTTSNFKGLLGDIPNSLTNLSDLGNLGDLGSFANLDSNLFGDDSGGDLVSGTTVAAGFKGTVDRKTVDAAFTRVLGSKKIGSPSYGAEGTATTPSPAEQDYLDVEQAENYLNDLDESAVTTA
jgi:hypothetical protein